MFPTHGWRPALRATLLWLALGITAQAAAEAAPLSVETDQLQTLTFSNLVVRVKGQSWMGVADADIRVKLLEHLRKRGYPALGAESLVFNRDKGDNARFTLGGTLFDAACDPDEDSDTDRLCRIEIKWELFDEADERVVYSMIARVSQGDLDLSSNNKRSLAAERLIIAALDSLLTRSRFVDTLKKSTKPEEKTVHYTPAQFRECGEGPRAMPASANAVLSATVLVETSGGFGSGTLISPDGLVLTAAHVVTGSNVEVKLMTGQTLPATVVRMHKAEDVALLYVSVPTDAPCLPLRPKAPEVGEEVYAIGSPASKDLAFTLTRGIVSGAREIEGVRYVQTDASVNPGNSGGPLIDREGKVIGVVSWKVVGRGMEGLAFGVPVSAAQSALAVTPGGATDASLRTKATGTTDVVAAFEDEPDVRPVVDPNEEEHARAKERKERRKKLRALRWKSTPTYVKVMKFGGLALAAAGAAGTLATWSMAQEDGNTYDDYKQARLLNDLSWAATLAGAGCFTASLFLTPKVTLPSESPAPSPTVQARLGLGSASLTVSF